MSKNLSLQELLSTNLSPNIADEETLKSISDNVNKTYLENYSVEQKTYLADLDPLKASASLVPSLSSSVTTINSKTSSWDNLEGLPAVSSTDNSKILMVVNGSWNLVSPSVIYSGTNTPTNTTGNDGDVYLQI